MPPASAREPAFFAQILGEILQLLQNIDADAGGDEFQPLQIATHLQQHTADLAPADHDIVWPFDFCIKAKVPQRMAHAHGNGGG